MFVVAAVFFSSCGDDLPSDVDTDNALMPASTTGGATTGADEGTTADGDTQADGSSTGGTPELGWPTLDCDPIAPSFCAFPFPSNVFTEPDPSSATGLRVRPPVDTFPNPTSEPWEAFDGFSPSAGLVVHLPGAAGTGLPSHAALADSLADDSPTVLLDTSTGQRVPHFAEIDFATDSAQDRALIIRPAHRLASGVRYIVGIRDVVDSRGATLPASPAFAALRDDTAAADEPSVEARRGLYDDIFTRLEAAAVPRDTLQIAWDFTTASDTAITERLFAMRDETFEALDGNAPTFTIDTIDTDFGGDEILFLARGSFEAPMYLTAPEAITGRLRIGDNGLPVAEGVIDVPFSIMVPVSAQTTPAALMQHGHGLFGDKGQIEGDHFIDMARQYNYAVFAVNWLGMSDGDAAAVVGTIGSGSPIGLASMMDRLHQGTLNQLLAMRVVAAGLSQDPQFEGLLATDERYYYGISQGGILGGVYMGVSTEVQRGVLDVMGQPYHLLLSRSVDFNLFFEFLANKYPDGRDRQYVLSLTQMLWDRVEPSGYTPFIRAETADTPAHEVLMTAAIGDHQVPTIGAHVMARSIDGLVHLNTGVREIWGMEQVEEHTGSAYVEYDFGLPPDPVCNLPQTACDDPHGKLRKLQAARDQIDHFLRTGQVRNFCPDGHCLFVEDNGCEPGERTPDVCQPLPPKQ